jgi:hypothetical protein
MGQQSSETLKSQSLESQRLFLGTARHALHYAQLTRKRPEGRFPELSALRGGRDTVSVGFAGIRGKRSSDAAKNQRLYRDRRISAECAEVSYRRAR